MFGPRETMITHGGLFFTTMCRELTIACPIDKSGISVNSDNSDNSDRRKLTETTTQKEKYKIIMILLLYI